MLEKETERLLTLFEQRTIGRGDAIAVKEILAAEIPHPIRVFFRTDVDRMLEDEHRRERTNTRFNHRHPEIQSLQRQIDSVLVLNFTFSRNEFVEKLHDGVHLLMNYLVRPQWTILNFLFNSRPSVSIDEMRSMTRYFGAYEYLSDIAVRYAQEKMIDNFTQPDLQKLLFRIDGEYMRGKDGQQLAQLLIPLYEFLGFPNIGCTKPVSTKAISRFFEDKNMRFISEMLDRHLTNGLTEMPTEILGADLEELRRSTPDAFAPQVIPSPNTRPTPHPTPSKPATPPPMRQEKIHEEQTPIPEPAVKRSVNSRSIHDLISEEDRKRFVKKIFLKDERQFEATIASLNGMTSWKQASIFIDEIFIAHEVDPYSSEAVRFTDLVYQHFFPTSQK